MSWKAREQHILAALWHRHRIIIQSDRLGKAHALFLEIKDLLPQYREWILCGNIPREARFLRKGRKMPSDDLEALRHALLESLNEEEMGAPPIQILYFDANADVLQELTTHVDRGWLATTDRPAGAVEALCQPKDGLRDGNGTIYILDPLPEDSSIEDSIIEESRFVSPAMKKYIIQNRQNQVQLAFQAVQGEVESRGNVSQAYLLEALDMRIRTLNKTLEIGFRERRLDLRSLIQETPPSVRKLLHDLSSLKELLLAAVFDGRDLLGFAKYRDIALPSRHIVEFWDTVEHLVQGFRLGRTQYAELGAPGHYVLLIQKDYLYAFALETEMTPVLFRAELDRLLAKD